MAVATINYPFRYPTAQEYAVYGTVIAIAFTWIYGRYWLRKFRRQKP